MAARYSRAMVIMTIIGAVLAVTGLGGILWCIRQASWIRNAQLEDTRVRAELNKLIFAHMAAIAAAFLGLGLLVVGLLLG